HGRDSHPRHFRSRPPGSLPSHSEHPHSRRRSTSRNRRATARRRRRARVPFFPSLTPARPQRGRCSLHADRGRLRADPRHLHRAQERARPHLLLLQWTPLQPSRDDAAALQEPDAADRVRRAEVVHARALRRPVRHRGRRLAARLRPAVQARPAHPRLPAPAHHLVQLALPDGRDLRGAEEAAGRARPDQGGPDRARARRRGRREPAVQPGPAGHAARGARGRRQGAGQADARDGQRGGRGECGGGGAGADGGQGGGEADLALLQPERVRRL
ncbi:hypothetical protein LTR39_005986, partial [Cryomyces antarcticus]